MLQWRRENFSCNSTYMLKKSNLDAGDLNSYRPTSNPSFKVSKVLERIIDDRFIEHANLFNLLSPVQSAYCKQ